MLSPCGISPDSFRFKKEPVLAKYWCDNLLQQTTAEQPRSSRWPIVIYELSSYGLDPRALNRSSASVFIVAAWLMVTGLCASVAAIVDGRYGNRAVNPAGKTQSPRQIPIVAVGGSECC